MNLPNEYTCIKTAALELGASWALRQTYRQRYMLYHPSVCLLAGISFHQLIVNPWLIRHYPNICSEHRAFLKPPYSLSLSLCSRRFYLHESC